MERILKGVLACLFILFIISGCGDSSGGGTTSLTDDDGSIAGDDQEPPEQGEPGEATHIIFISAEPTYIALNNTGGTSRSETSVLYFKITDLNGDPVNNVAVDFELSTEIGGLYLSTVSAVSDASGLVQTVVNSGTVSTEVKVQATVRDSDPLITVVSDTLIISTGLADQNSLSLGPETINPEGWHYFNIEVPVTILLADHFNNFVPDGTVVYFTTELGSIDESCVIVDGACEAIWRSGNPQYSDCNDDDPPCWPGISTITAFLIGEESFFDNNSNGFFDAEDEFDVLSDVAPDVFRDDNWSPINQDETREDSEPYWDFNGNNVYDGAGNGIYNGSLCSDEAETSGLCSKELVYIRAQTHIVPSGSFAYGDDAEEFIISPATLDLRGQSSGVLTINISDLNGNPWPAESSVTIETTNGEVFRGGRFDIPNTTSATVYQVIVLPSVDDGNTTGILYAIIETPFGNVSYSNAITILDDN